jgi:hypothetical protein
MKIIICSVVILCSAFPALACDKDKALDLWVAKKSMQYWVLTAGNAQYEKATLIACKAIVAKPAGFYNAADSCVDGEGSKISSKDILDNCKYFISLGDKK